MGYPGVLVRPDAVNFICLSPGMVPRERYGIHSGRGRRSAGQASTSLSPLFRFRTAIPGADSALYPGELVRKFGSGLYHYRPQGSGDCFLGRFSMNDDRLSDFTWGQNNFLEPKNYDGSILLTQPELMGTISSSRSKFG